MSRIVCLTLLALAMLAPNVSPLSSSTAIAQQAPPPPPPQSPAPPRPTRDCHEPPPIS